MTGSGVEARAESRRTGPTLIGHRGARGATVLALRILLSGVSSRMVSIFWSNFRGGKSSSVMVQRPSLD